MVSGTIPIPQNDVTVCKEDKRQGDFNGKRTIAQANKSPSAYFFVWVRVICGFRIRVGLG